MEKGIAGRGEQRERDRGEVVRQVWGGGGGEGGGRNRRRAGRGQGLVTQEEREVAVGS